MRTIYQVLRQGSIEQRLLVLLAIFLPFEYLPSFTLSQFTIRPSVIIGVALIFLAGIRFFTGKTILRQFSLPYYLLFLWFMLLAAGLLRADDPNAALKVLVPLGFLVGMAISVSLLLKKEYLKSIIYGVLIGAAISILFGLLQFAGNLAGLPESVTGLRPEYSWQGFGFPRLQSVALEPLYFSCFLLLPITLLTSLLIYKREYRRWPLFVLLGICVVADFLTLSRGGLAAFVLIILTLLFVARRQLMLRHHIKSVAVVTATSISILIIVVLLVGAVAKQGQDSDLTYNSRGTSTLLSHLTNINFFAGRDNTMRDDSIAQRDTARSQAINIIGENPELLLNGTGVGQYQNFVNTNYPGVYAAPNNVILEQLLQTGLTGFILLFAFVLSVLIQLFRSTRTANPEVKYLAVALFVYIIAVGFQAQTFAGLTITHLWFGIGLALFLLQLGQVPIKNKTNAASSSKKVTKI